MVRDNFGISLSVSEAAVLAIEAEEGIVQLRRPLLRVSSGTIFCFLVVKETGERSALGMVSNLENLRFDIRGIREGLL